MAFYFCGNSVPTETYSVTRNGSYDMGEGHKNRYVNVAVSPTGGLSQIYRGELGMFSQSPSVSFTAANNCLYVAHFRAVSYDTTLGWTRGANLTFGGSARYWNTPGYLGQSNANGNMAYNASAAAYVIGNGSSVSITWPVTRGFMRFCVIDLYQINW
jgi:hypothetical protein